MDGEQLSKIWDMSKLYVKSPKMQKWIEYIVWSYKHDFKGSDILAALEIMKIVMTVRGRAEIPKYINEVVDKYVGQEGESGHQDEMRKKFIIHVYRDFVVDFIKRKRRTAILCWCKYLQEYTDNAKEHYYDNDPDLFKI